MLSYSDDIKIPGTSRVSGFLFVLQRPERGGAIFLQNIVCHIFSGKVVPKASAGHLRSVSASGATTENRRALRATTVFVGNRHGSSAARRRRTTKRPEEILRISRPRKIKE